MKKIYVIILAIVLLFAFVIPAMGQSDIDINDLDIPEDKEVLEQKYISLAKDYLELRELTYEYKDLAEKRRERITELQSQIDGLKTSYDSLHNNIKELSNKYDKLYKHNQELYDLVDELIKKSKKRLTISGGLNVTPGNLKNTGVIIMSGYQF